MTRFWRSTIIATIIFVAAFVVFCPRFYLWDVLGGPDYAESNRAFFSFVQLMNSPWVHIPDVGNEVLEWRLLFPVVCHALKVHWVVYFALPHLCMLGVLVWVAYWVQGRTGSTWAAIAATALTATSSVYFVSTGFLGYFDSALALGLLVAAFGRRNVTVWAAASLAPWVDERFIFALPIIAWCQWCLSGKWDWKKMVALGLGVAPYLILRLISWAWNTDFTGQFFHHMATRFIHEPDGVLWGVWDTFRWGWVAIIAAVVAAPGLKRMYALTVIPMVMTYLVLCNGDYPRSTGVLLPMLVLGTVLLARQKKRWMLGLLIVAAVVNFATPAYQSFRAFRWQINPLVEQLKINKIINDNK